MSAPSTPQGDSVCPGHLLTELRYPIPLIISHPPPDPVVIALADRVVEALPPDRAPSADRFGGGSVVRLVILAIENEVRIREPAAHPVLNP